MRPFPDVNSGRWQVSTDGGSRPLWARDGKELFYLSPTGALMVVPVHGERAWRAGTPSKLFDGHYYYGGVGTPDRPYDVSPDGRRFLMIKNAENPNRANAGSRIVVVENWFEELKRRVPLK